MSKSASAFSVSCSLDGNPLVASAAEDLERICERIERDKPEAARRVARTIYLGCTRLKDFPNLGRARVRIAGRAHAVEISRIFHAAQDWP